MSTTVDGNIGAGFRFIVAFTNNADGDIIGSDATEPTAGASDGNSGVRVEGAQTMPTSIPDSEFVDVLGDDKPMVQFDFGAASSPNGVLELAARNPYLEAMLQGTTVLVKGNLIVGVLGPEDSELAALSLLMGRQSKTWKPGNRSTPNWELLFIPSVTLSPKGAADWTQRAVGPYRYGMSMSKGSKFPWGETLYDAAVGTESTTLVPIQANYPYWVDIFKGNGVNATFNLSKTPVLTDTAVVTVDRVEVAEINYTLSVAPNRITFTGGNEPAVGGLVDVFYPVEPKNL